VLWTGWKGSAEGFVPRMAVGFASGILSGSISLGAPPVAIFLTAGSTPKHVFRSSVSAYLTAQNVMSAIAFALRGAYTADYFKGLALLLPFVLAGTWLGSRFASRVNEQMFRRGVMILIIVSGLSLLI
ncbi:MAG: sulfite exporter TauE/SafE family protein, partial [Pyramidobacter sp.]|nr:sulfite exporter TauE/SafE family protein [Pyramidobacter sp.]